MNWNKMCPVAAKYVQSEQNMSNWSRMCPVGAKYVQLERNVSSWSKLCPVGVKHVQLSEIYPVGADAKTSLVPVPF